MSIEITIPRLGWSMEEGTFVGWMKKDGDLVRRGEALFELEGEKALQEIEALDDGVLQISPGGPQPGSLLKVGEVIGYLVPERKQQANAVSSGASDEKTILADIPTNAPEARSKPTSEQTTTDFVGSPSVRRLARELNIPLHQVRGAGLQGRITEDDVRAVAGLRTSVEKPIRIIATPRARRAARHANVDLEQVQGTGRNGRIRERDVIDASALNSTGPTSLQSQRIVLSSRRKVIAERLAESRRQTVPVTLTAQADATNLVSLREQFKVTNGSIIPAYHDIIAKLVANCLRQERHLAGRREENWLILPGDAEFHIGLAVDTPEGLIVPVLRDVLNKPLLILAAESARIISKSREGRLSGRESQDAVFTITNLGSFGIDFFTPVINLPETAILGLGAIRKQAVVLTDDRIEARHVITLSLTFNHCSIDGAPAARFLKSLVDAIQNPAAQLLANG